MTELKHYGVLGMKWGAYVKKTNLALEPMEVVLRLVLSKTRSTRKSLTGSGVIFFEREGVFNVDSIAPVD